MKFKDTGERRFLRASTMITAALASLAVGACKHSPECEPFTIYAQNKFPPPGALGRAYASKDSEVVVSFGKNEKLTTIGYVEVEEPVYPDNPEAIDGDHWFLVTTPTGNVYVNDAAVRAEITEQDPEKGLGDDIGPIVELKPECELTN